MEIMEDAHNKHFLHVCFQLLSQKVGNDASHKGVFAHTLVVVAQDHPAGTFHAFDYGGFKYKIGDMFELFFIHMRS